MAKASDAKATSAQASVAADAMQRPTSAKNGSRKRNSTVRPFAHRTPTQLHASMYDPKAR